MTNWKQWTDWFVELFGLTDKQVPTVAAWIREAFVPGGLAPDELKAAALDVIRAGPPRFLSEMPAALFDALRERRVEAQMARDDQARKGGADVSVPGCRLCDGTGWVSVPQTPQPDGAAPKGYLQTCCVTCRCVAGLRLSGSARTRADAAAMTLEQYEARHGTGWADEVLWWRKRQAAQGRVRSSPQWQAAEAAVRHRAAEAAKKESGRRG